MKIRFLTGFAIALALVFALGTSASADLDLAPKDTRSDLDKRLDALQPAYEQMERERRQREIERAHPNPHRGRIRTDDNTSIGGKIGTDGGEVNIRRDY